MFDNYELTFKINTDTVESFSEYIISVKDNILIVKSLDDNLDKSFSFKNLTTKNSDHNLPFELTINDVNPKDSEHHIKIFPFKNYVNSMIGKVKVSASGRGSDQLNLNLTLPNLSLANEYLNVLISEFDKDGITDRQLEYKRTMDFVDSRSEYISKELELVELRKEEFKKNNNINELTSDAVININQMYSYDNELLLLDRKKI